MGTLQNGVVDIFEKIAQACVNLKVQLVISLGGSNSFSSLPKLSGDPLVVNYAPQLELLEKASLTITHGGMNTTLESLTYGVPIVAIPITNDQPGVATRIVYTGSGELITLSIHQAGGVTRAVEIIEKAIATQKPVLNNALL